MAKDTRYQNKTCRNALLLLSIAAMFFFSIVLSQPTLAACTIPAVCNANNCGTTVNFLDSCNNANTIVCPPCMCGDGVCNGGETACTGNSCNNNGGECKADCGCAVGNTEVGSQCCSGVPPLICSYDPNTCGKSNVVVDSCGNRYNITNPPCICGDGVKNGLEQCDGGDAAHGNGNGVCPLKNCSTTCTTNDCTVHWMGHLIDGTDGSTLVDGWVFVGGTRYDVIAPTAFDIPLQPGDYVATASGDGFDSTEVNVTASLNPLKKNVTLMSSVCKDDCSLGGRCNFDECASICGVTDPAIIAACNGKLVGSVQPLNATHHINCCKTPVLSSGLGTSFSMNTCSSQVIPMKRMVLLNGRMYTLVVASFNSCE